MENVITSYVVEANKVAWLIISGVTRVSVIINCVVNDINRIVHSVIVSYVHRSPSCNTAWWSDKSASKKIILFYEQVYTLKIASLLLFFFLSLNARLHWIIPPAWGIDHFEKYVASGRRGGGGGYFNDNTYSLSIIIKWNKVFRLCSEVNWNLRTMRSPLQKNKMLKWNFFGPQAKTWSTSSRRRKGIF